MTNIKKKTNKEKFMLLSTDVKKIEKKPKITIKIKKRRKITK